MNIPLKVKKNRVDDIKRILLPEMVSAQLKLVDETFSEEVPNQLELIKDSNSPGMGIITLVGARANELRASGNELYADRASDHQPTQVGLVIENTDIFIRQAEDLHYQLTAVIKEAGLEALALADRIIETAFHIGYYAGSNDSLAITDRYTNSGYTAKVTQPQKGGQSKAKAIEPVKKLVHDMASHIYQNQSLSSTPKAMLVEAIDSLLREFSQKGGNNNIPSLIKFASRSPEPQTLMAWVKGIKKPKNLHQPPKPSLAVVMQTLKSTYTMQAIKSALNINSL
jgi:hypothetical protein